MKRLLIAILLLVASVASAADVKITDLPEMTVPKLDDAVLVVDAPATTNTTKYIKAGNLAGKIVVAAKSSAYTLGTDNPIEAYGGMVVLTGAAVVTLPTAVVGMSACVYANTASAVSVKAGAGDHWIMTTGTALDNGDKITQTGSGGLVCFGVLEANHWFIFGYRGTWADDGA
jgi:hypothetical protein